MSEFKYLIRRKEYGNDVYKIAGSDALYGSRVCQAIHDEMPHWIPESGGADHEVIRSDSKEFMSILVKDAQRLRREIQNAQKNIGKWNSELFIIEEALGNDDPTGIGEKMDSAFNNLGFMVTAIQQKD